MYDISCKKGILFILICMISFNSFFTSTVLANDHDEDEGKAAIIIDDFGGNVGGVDLFFDSDVPVTFAIMPFLDQSTEQAEKAHELGHEVIIHLSLEPKSGKASWLGPLPITSNLSDEEIRERVEQAIEDVPHAKGLNNHMGSKIVEDERVMGIILDVAKDYNLYIIDSATSGKSVIPRLAEEKGLTWGTRDTFLDDSTSSRDYVYKQMRKLCERAKSQGRAIGIGHVGIKGNDTYNGIHDALEHFQENNVDIVPASHLIDSPIEKNPDSFWQQG
ncbi:divergent polysaccharide deacetylase family protein [Texcoconibacillus texcoconensis]|uniref:Divergent polysaccharide deacetylase family protein n=1 Tax=Texcoconibacillus texcoconensis TaxID=1095777 RepID=A0A840QNQ1_9BACI|nr:divergent polysaccharide deacetylase family protein [Texcoconibacillus texcoconensis]MBB5173012.1 hypothetical protein [Texcoconibacillus texcoconensis]